ncbi:MAG TPA: hypothetical protein VGN52_11490 [Burkholderiales bacterium]
MTMKPEKQPEELKNQRSQRQEQRRQLENPTSEEATETDQAADEFEEILSKKAK